MDRTIRHQHTLSTGYAVWSQSASSDFKGAGLTHGQDYSIRSDKHGKGWRKEGLVRMEGILLLAEVVVLLYVDTEDVHRSDYSLQLL